MPIKPPPGAAEGFIALIQRSEQMSADCSFDVKVRCCSSISTPLIAWGTIS